MTKDVIKKEIAINHEDLTDQGLRTKIIPGMKVRCEPKLILENLRKMISELVAKDGLIAFSTDEDTQKLLRDSMMILGLDNHRALIDSIKDEYRPLAMEFANSLAKEYDCKTPSEKALSQVAVTAYISLMDSSSRYIACSEAGEYLSDGRTKHLAVLSKQIDRANRQFLSALMTLKQLKNPLIQVNVKTQTAFIAQNQQLNNNQNETNNP